MSDTWQQHQRELYETINGLLSQASFQPRENQTIHLATALGPFFLQCEVRVLWRPPKKAGARLGVQGAFWSPDEGVIALANEQIDRLIEAAAESLNDVRTHSSASTSRLSSHISEISDGSFALVFSNAAPESEKPGKDSRAAELWILITDISGEVAEHVRMFRKDLSGLTFIYRSFRALARAGEPARLATRVAKLRRNTGASFSRRLREACDIVDDLDLHLIDYGDEYISVIMDLAEAVMNEMLGVGWDVQNADGDKGDRNVERFIEKLHDLTSKHYLHDSSGLRQLSRIGFIIGCTVPGEQRFLADEVKQESTADFDLDLMARWTEMYQLSRRLGRDSGGVQSQNFGLGLCERWRDLAQASVEGLHKILNDTFKKCHEVRFLPSWLRLWFCHILLIEELEHAYLGQDDGSGIAMSSAQRWRFRRDLAYVIRECLRHFRYGKDPSYIFLPTVFSAALRTLVEYHAVRVLSLPQGHDIRGLLREIGRVAGSGDYYFAAGHLQHVLEIYIAGQFYCDFIIAAPGRPFDEWSMEEVLASRSAWRPGTLKRRELRKAFSLAALLHDVGMLLFPDWARSTDSLGEIDDELARSLLSVREVLGRSAGDLVRLCDQELRNEGYYDPTLEPLLARWSESCIEDGVAEHCVLGAWFVHRVCQNVAELSRDTIQQAVRAVLLHRVVTQPIEVDSDPAAALLVMCDEVFMWKHSFALPRTNHTGHSFQSLAVDVRPQSTLYDFLKIEGLSLVDHRHSDRHDLTDIERLRLFGRLDLQAAASGDQDIHERRAWPKLEIRLKDPDYLETPVYFTWLMIAQNLGRIRRSEFGWAPLIKLWSKISGRLEYCDLDNRRLLQEVANRASMSLRPSLERWLANDHRFGLGGKGEEPLAELVREIAGPDLAESELAGGSEKWEWIKITALRSFHRKDIFLCFEELGNLVEQVLREEELIRRDPRGGRDKTSEKGDKSKTDSSRDPRGDRDESSSRMATP